MKRLVRFHTIVLVVILLTGTILFSTGCPPLFNPPFIDAPLIVSDGSDDAIAIYEVLKGDDARELYAQRISASGDLQWGEKGVLVARGYERESGTFDLHMVSDGTGGAIFTWEAYPTKPDWDLPFEKWTVHRVTTILRLDSQGNTLWRRETKPFYHIISDSSGGVIISFVDYTSEAKTLGVLRIDSQGNYPWGQDGVQLYFGNYSSSLRMAGDGSGGLIIVQQDLTEAETRFQVFAHKISADGSLAWGQRGIILHYHQRSLEPTEVVSDGLGGALFIWQVNVGEDIYIQRVDASGSLIWEQDGKQLGLRKDEDHFPHHVLATADGQGGAIITWEEIGQGGMQIYAQKIDAAGNAQWQPGGIQVFNFDVVQSFYISTIGNDDRGAIIVWWYQGTNEDKEGALRAQRLDTNGKTIWQVNGVPVTTGVNGHPTPAAISREGHGGVLIAWGVGRNRNHAEKSYIQRIDAEGNRLWGDGGIRLNP